MTAIQQLWLASAAGALLFFVAGILVTVLRRGAPVAPAAIVPPPVELDQLRQRAERADAAAGAALAQVQAETAEREHKLASAEAARAAAEAAQATLQAELATMTARLRRAQAVAPAAAQTPGRATVELTRLAERMRETEHQLEARTAELGDASAQLAQLEVRLADAEAMRADCLRLANEMERLTHEVDRLTGELASARSIALGGARRSVAPVRSPGAAAPGSITEALHGAFERFSDAQMRGIAIADNVGFPVSSYGEDGVELAAYAALLNDVASRANQFLPVATLASIEVLDEHGARISVWPFNLGEDRLMLVNLAVGATDARRVEVMLSDVLAILQPSEAPRGTTA